MKLKLWHKNYLYTIVTLMLLANCTGYSSKEQHVSTIPVDVTKDDQISSSDYFSKIEIIPLEMKPDVVINAIDKIIPWKNSYFVLDRKQRVVFKFDSAGHFVTQIGRLGAGPGEYSMLTDLEINPFTDQVELLSPMGKINTYSTDGKYISSFWIKEVNAVHYFKNITSDVIAFYSKTDENRLLFYSRKQGKIYKRTHPVPEYIFEKTFLNPKYSPFSNSDNIQPVTFFEPFSNNVYDIKEDSLHLKYAWDFGKSNFIVEEQFPSEKSTDFYLNYLMTDQSHAFKFMHNFENDKYIYTSFLFKQRGKTLIYNKQNRNYIVAQHFKDSTGFMPRCGWIDNKKVISVVEPKIIDQFVREKMLDDRGQALLKAIKPTDNPIIIRYEY